MLRHTLVSLSLKIGLAITLLYACLGSFVVPALIVDRWPLVFSNNLSEGFLSVFTGLASLLLVAWIFSGKYQFTVYAGISAILILIGIFNTSDIPLIFDLIPLLFISIALALRYYPRIRVVAQTKITPLDNPTVHIHPHDPAQHTSKHSDQTHKHSQGKDHDQHLFVTKR